MPPQPSPDVHALDASCVHAPSGKAIPRVFILLHFLVGEKSKESLEFQMKTAAHRQSIL